MIKYFKEKKENEMIGNLLSKEPREQMLAKITALQNEISVAFNTKVLVITSIGEDKLAAAFAKAFVGAYETNNSNALLIDANLYNPCLSELMGGKVQGPAKSEKPEEVALDILPLGNKNGVVCMEKEIYPSDIYKSGVIQKLVSDNMEKYEHIVVLMPSILEHREVLIFKDLLDSVMVVARRAVTKKRDIFEALSFLSDAQMPVSKTVILK